MAFFDWLSTTALSIIFSGNTGVSPFMSLFLIGLLEKTNPDLLQMDGTIEWILSSWFTIVIWAMLMVLEFVGKCIPVVDEVIDSAMTFVVPIFSIMGSLATFGLFNAVNNGENLEDEGRRRLTIASAALTFLQIVLIGVGIVLALCMHGIKMLVRLIGEGWLTYCLTIIETLWVVMTICIAVYIRQVAVVIAVIIVVAAGYNIKKRYIDEKNPAEIAAEHGYVLDEEQPAVVAVAETITVEIPAEAWTKRTIMVAKS